MYGQEPLGGEALYIGSPVSEGDIEKKNQQGDNDQ